MGRFNFLDFFTNNGLKKHSALDTVPQSLLHFLLSFSSPREINPNWPVLWEKKIVPLLIGLLLHGGGQGSQLWVVKYREQKEGSLSSLSISSGLDLALPGLAFKYPSDSLPSASLFFSRGRVSSPTAGYLRWQKCSPRSLLVLHPTSGEILGLLLWFIKRWIRQKRNLTVFKWIIFKVNK